MDDAADLQELNALLGSRVPIVLVETHEEPRVLSMLSRIAQRTTMPMFHWIVDFPGEAARRRIFEIHLRKRRLDPAAFDLAALAAHSEQFSGAEIEQAIVAASFETRAHKAALDTAAVTAELMRTRPLSTVMAERIDALRDWASTRSVMADVPEPESSEATPKHGPMLRGIFGA